MSARNDWELFSRKEYKYRVPSARLDELRKRMLTQMRHDPFCEGRPEHVYCVRSIYLDSPRFQFYHEKLDGLKVRKKLRIRTYNTTEKHAPAYLEIKRKRDDTIFKERSTVSMDDALGLLNGAAFDLAERSTTPVLGKFAFLIKRHNLGPRVLITYEREAFFGMDDPSVRVTFDLRCRSYYNPTLDDIFRERDLKAFSDPHFILELKFYERMPAWLREIGREFRLNRESISKYCTGLDAWLPQLGKQA